MLALAGFAAAGASGSCLVLTEVFSCQQDEHCVSGESVGQCQSNGHCSFLDATCPSQQRYGQHGPSELAGECVPDAVDAGTSEGDPWATTAARPPDSITTRGGATGGESTATTADNGGGTHSTTNATGSTTAASPPACAPFVDTFEDGDLSAWSLALNLAETDGELRLTLDPPADGFTSASLEEGLHLSGGAAAAVELGRVPTTSGYQLMVQMVSPVEGESVSYDFILFADPSSAPISSALATGASTEDSTDGSTGDSTDGSTGDSTDDFDDGIVEPDVLGLILDLRRTDGASYNSYARIPFRWADHRWLRLRSVPGGLVFEASGDGLVYSALYSLTNGEVQEPMDDWGIRLAAIDFDNLPETVEVSFRTFEFTCE